MPGLVPRIDSSCLSSVIAIAPNTAPGTLPIPPIAIITTNSTLITIGNDSDDR
jgi:hypothetical protein